ncbi:MULTISPECIES: hypothetical protein [Planktothricoides]|uniref:Uncharacterized protein n=2 Tax=Planktothricoides raciborskii TaxID=132608 RepID=A0AAU8JJH7_9CYAN|nr:MULTISPECIES: hypothetical protein [Planktothricoides]MBD2545703.1 hypothetical protein [Planktothricoides raciborskii FACHB-1370]MBD2582725.1 hypothetical protein [Planktothricoides raciborskii FACHB-1261]
MKADKTATTNNTQKPSQDIRNNSLFTNMTAEEEVFVRGGTQRFRAAELL